MVAAEKAHRLVQHPSKPAAQEADANALLVLFDEKIAHGLPDEAFRLATAAADLFYKHGDKVGESRAVSCVAQAMAAGATPPVKSEGSFGDQAGSVMQDSFASLGSSGLRDYERRRDKAEDSSIYTELTELPISYGERLILETCMKCKGRPYDRQRQEALAQPRRRGANAEAWGISASSTGPSTDRSTVQHGTSGGGAQGFSGATMDPSDSLPLPCKPSQETRLSSSQEAALVSRLSQPKRRKASARPPGEQIILKSHERTANAKVKLKNEEPCVDGIWRRPGEDRTIEISGCRCGTGEGKLTWSSGAVESLTTVGLSRCSMTMHGTPVTAMLEQNGDELHWSDGNIWRRVKNDRNAVDISSIVARLSAPRATRALSPTPGERVVLMWNRSENLRKPDFNRLAELAKSSRRGGSARAWGVFDAPASARSWMSHHEDLVCSPTSHTAREKLPGTTAKEEMMPSNEGSVGYESALPPLETSPLESPQAKVSPTNEPLQDVSSNVMDASQDMGYTWHHPWKRHGVDRHA